MIDQHTRIRSHTTINTEREREAKVMSFYPDIPREGSSFSPLFFRGGYILASLSPTGFILFLSFSLVLSLSLCYCDLLGREEEEEEKVFLMRWR